MQAYPIDDLGSELVQAVLRGTATWAQKESVAAGGSVAAGDSAKVDGPWNTATCRPLHVKDKARQRVSRHKSWMGIFSSCAYRCAQGLPGRR